MYFGMKESSRVDVMISLKQEVGSSIVIVKGMG